MDQGKSLLESEIQRLTTEVEAHKKLLQEESSEGMRDLILEEITNLETSLKALNDTKEHLNLSQHHDPSDEPNPSLGINKNVVILEVRSGTGGDEAGLFAAELYEMYKRYAEKKSWKMEEVSVSRNAMGGFKTASAYIKGPEVYESLKNESGVHRVQRVPLTESSGRIHTSTATVAVLPEPGKYEITIRPEEIREDFFRSGGHGGQNVNKVSTAVRITHIPTGEVVECQQERSQLKNRERAMAVLKARLFEMMREQNVQDISNLRYSQVGTGERSEKIRTYNFPQDRVTDHRINTSWHNLQSIMMGNIEEMLESLRGIGEDGAEGNNITLPIDD
ncbi:MAG: PCRF domain-containing protein [Patescibacteria group bacterium]|jgi:peptide chain release factor 1